MMATRAIGKASPAWDRGHRPLFEFETGPRHGNTALASCDTNCRDEVPNTATSGLSMGDFEKGFKITCGVIAALAAVFIGLPFGCTACLAVFGGSAN